MIRMELWHVLGRIFQFTPKFIQGASVRQRLVIDWRCVPLDMYKILNCQDADAIKLEIERKSQWKKDSATHSKSDRLFIDQIGQCHYCKRPTERANWSIDHIVPISKGGRRIVANEVGACRPCNSNKGSKSVQEFLDSSYFKSIKT